MVDMICDVDILIEKLQKAKKENRSVWIKHRGTFYKWRENHELCIRNYEKMKASRERIIRQRDNLQAENKRLKGQIETLEEFGKLKDENNSLYQSLHILTAEKEKTEQMLEQLRREHFEYRRRYNLIRKIIDGQI